MKYHFIGIGGVGMSALARIMLAKEHEVSGSDIKKSYVTDDLEKIGIRIVYEQKKENIQEGQIIVYSTDIKHDNPELIAAKNHKMMHRSELLQELLSEKKALLVVGAHGKTTVTSLLSYICKNTSFVIGGFSPSFEGVNGRVGKGDYFIAEGDESDGSFLKAAPHGAIITNVDFDHLDYWKSKEALLKAYQTFIKGVQNKKLLFYFYEDPFLSMWEVEGISFGFQEGADLQAKNIRGRLFDIEFQGKRYLDVEVSLLGRHNILNALACFGMAISLGVNETDIRLALQTFKGVKRRLELKGECKGALVYDDYAHHPKEIIATLAALKEAFIKQRKIAIFQPHRYSRMKDFIDDFAASSTWKDVDELIVTDIYSAGEQKIEGVTIEALLKKLKRNFTYIPRNEIVQHIQERALSGDVIVALGAGDITGVAKELVTQGLEKN